MSVDESQSSSGEPGTEARTIADPRQHPLNLPVPPAYQAMIDLERQRIESTNRRTDVVKYAIEANDAADRRQYEYQLARLNNDAVSDRERHRLASALIYGGGVAATLLAAGLFGMAFFGNDHQSSVALSIVSTIGIAVAGYGLIAAAQSGIGKLMRDGDPR